MNIPKDAWMFNMDKNNPNHIVLAGEDPLQNSATTFERLAESESDWEIEVGPNSTPEEVDATLNKLNRLIGFVKDSTNELSALKTENKPNIKIRRDIFGNEIKKGGKQRISFADNVQILKSRKKFEDEGSWLYGNRYKQYVDLSNINNNKIPKIRGLKRSLIGLKNDKLKKRYDIGNSDKKILSLVEVIKIENYKELNKMSNFGIPKENENIKETQDTVCCSGTCFIY
jgi:hypothetical protein